MELITEAANSETKSTAGDKHETSRAMMQLEQEKLGRQLKELHDQKLELEKIGVTKPTATIAKGALIKTDKSYLFIAIGLGKLTVEGRSVIAISSNSPLAKKLIGSKQGEALEINGTSYNVQTIE